MFGSLLGLFVCVLSILTGALAGSLALVLRGSQDRSDRLLGALLGAAALLWAAGSACAALYLRVTEREGLLVALSLVLLAANIAAAGLVARAVEAAARP